jgi:hypothetical protein
MTCADPAMSTSFIHDVSAQYFAAVMFALTVATAGAVRTAWRRRRRRQGQEQAVRTRQPAVLAARARAERDPASSQGAETSSSRRREESS